MRKNTSTGLIQNIRQIVIKQIEGLELCTVHGSGPSILPSSSDCCVVQVLHQPLNEVPHAKEHIGYAIMLKYIGFFAYTAP